MINTTRSICLAAALFGAASASFAQARISSFEVRTGTAGVQVDISGTSLSKPKAIEMRGGLTWIAEFDAALTPKPAEKEINAFGIKSIGAVWYQAKPPKTRFVFRLDEKMTPQIVKTKSGWSILLGEAPAESSVVPPVMNGALPPIQADAKGSLKSEDLKVSPNDNSGTKPIGPMPGPMVAPNPKPIKTANPTAPLINTPQTISVLEFTQADVVQILKAISLEANVNIITSPDVSPAGSPTKLTVSLRRVSLEDALAYVTTMANLRYAKLGNTFFVTPTATFSKTMRSLFERGTVRFETRVVSLVSGEAANIRQAVFAAKAQDGSSGFYDIQDPYANAPSFMTPAETSAPAGGKTAPGGEKADEKAPAQNSGPTLAQKVFYLMVVGEAKRLEEIASYITELDQKIARSYSINKSEDTGSVAVPIQSGQTAQIKTMVEKLLEGNPRRGDFSISETSLKELSEGDMATTMMLLIGPKSELETLRRVAVTMDEQICKFTGIPFSAEGDEQDRQFVVVDLKYIEPQVAAFDLKNRIRGLGVSILPDPVTPGLQGEATQSKDDKTKSAEAGKEIQKDELKKTIGRERMALVLRGTKKQIDEAKTYLSMVDLAPRQIALELRVMELAKEDAQKFGIDWSAITGGRLTNFAITQGNNDGAISGDYRFQGSDAVKFLATLDKLNSGRNTIARPNGLVTDGRGYKLFVGDTIRYVESIQSTQNGVTIVTNSIDVGVTFDVMARIGAGGSISLDLSQEFKILNRFDAVPGGGSLPQTSERRTNNFVTLKAGEAIAFGGLIQEQDRKRINGIPILMDLPIIGRLFSREERTKIRNEIVFILVAIEVTDGNRTDAADPRKTSGAATVPPVKY